jgi:thiosulfate/3-mercaptopyruvate sulfurtransferase
MSTPLLVSASWLIDHFKDADVRVVDTRFVLGKPDAGGGAFRSAHIQGAIFADLERDLSLPVREDRVGGRHPLPEAAALQALIRGLGISSDTHVVAYDDPSVGGGAYAPHLWWVLRYLGHEKVSVLDGGFPAWIAVDGPVEKEARSYSAGDFEAHPQSQMLVDANYVLSRRGGTTLLDSRAGERYRGEKEPVDRLPGHIPGAMNVDWAAGLDGGHWKPAEAQHERFEKLKKDAEIVVYCGSGVTACANLLAMEIAGVTGAKLYAGSWSDWISDPSRPIATGAE